MPPHSHPSWPFALVARKQPTYILVGILLGALHFGVCMLARSYLPMRASGEGWVMHIRPGWGIPIYFSLELTYLILTAHFALRGAYADCKALRGVVDTQAADETLARFTRVPRLAWLVVPLVGCGFWAAHMAAMGELTQLAQWYSRMPGYSVFTNTDVFVFEIFVTLIVCAFIRSAWLLYRLGLCVGEVDPLDVHPLHRFSRSGPRMALCLAGSLVLALPLAGFDISFFAVPLAITTLASLALFLLPLVGVRRQIVRAKKTAMDLLGRALAGDLEALQSTRFAGVQELSELVILRQAVADTPTWPVSQAGWRRFATYVLLPLFSWLASEAFTALV